MADKEEPKLKDPAIAMKKKLIAQEAIRQIDLAHEKSLTAHSRKKILAEEDYVSSLERIIERDFFPDLKKLQMNEEWLVARKNDDMAKMRDIQSRYHSGQFSGANGGLGRRLETPNFKETPMGGYLNGLNGEEFVGEDPLDEIARKNNLTTFHRNFANEDDVSFSKILGDERLEHQKKHWWKNLNQQNVLMIEAPDGGNSLKAIGWAEPGENVLTFVPKGISVADNPQFKPPLMSTSNTRFQADPHVHLAESREETESKEMELLKLLTKQQQSRHRRGPQPEFNKESDKIDLDGLDLVTGSKKARVAPTNINGFELIQQAEIRLQSDPIRSRESNSNSAPMLLDNNLGLGASVTGFSSFHVPQTPKREQLGQELAANAQRNIKKRSQSKSVSSLSSSGNTSVRSDAAKKMAAQMSHRSLMGTDSQLRSSYSPYPHQAQKKGGVATPSAASELKRKHSMPALTPTSSLFERNNGHKKKKPNTQPTASIPSYSNITDGLL